MSHNSFLNLLSFFDLLEKFTANEKFSLEENKSLESMATNLELRSKMYKDDIFEISRNSSEAKLRDVKNKESFKNLESLQNIDKNILKTSENNELKPNLIYCWKSFKSYLETNENLKKVKFLENFFDK